MKAAALTQLRRIELMTVADPVIEQDREVLLALERIGVCGSDLHYFEEGRIGPRAVSFPFLMGHECSATVVRTGRAVTRVRAGDRVAVDPAISCHQCDQCRKGRPHTCRRLRFLGCPGEAPGCLSEFLVMPESSLYPLPPKVSLDQGALCEPLSIGIYAVKQSRAGTGADLAILGSGPIGLCVLLASRHAGAGRIYVTDKVLHRLEVARQAGADWTGNPLQEDIVEAILRQQPLGLEVVYECAGQQETLDQALRLLKPGGRLMLIGIPRTERISFAIDEMRRKEITAINVRRQNDCVSPAIHALATGAIQPDFLVSHRFTLDQTQQAFELLAEYRDGVIKAIIEFPKTTSAT